MSSLLKAAIERQEVPPGLAGRIRERLEFERPRRFFLAPWRLQIIATAALVTLCVVTWWTVRREPMPSLTDRPAQDAYIRKVSAAVSAVVRVGLGDHIHCSIFRTYPKNPPTVAEMETQLGPNYRGLLPVVQAALPADYRVIMAHKCGYAGRKFVHLTLTDGKELLSLVIAQKQDGETLSNLRPAIVEAGLPVYQAQTQKYQVAAFEAPSQIAYVVSEERPADNLAIAVALAPGVRRLLVEAKA